MEQIVRTHIERLPEGLYLGTPDDVQGLVAQGRTVAETMKIAHDVARRLLEAREERKTEAHLPSVGDQFDCLLVVGS